MTEAGRANHMRNLWKKMDDPTRCDNVIRSEAARATTVPLITVPVGHTLSDNNTLLARRQPCTWQVEREQRNSYLIEENRVVEMVDSPRDMTALQDSWEEYLKDVAGLCSDSFWKIFLRLHTCAVQAIDAALNAVKKVYVAGPEKKQFPISRRSLLKSMSDKIRPFWSHVLHSHRIKLSQFSLPSATSEIEFHFIDPIWGWLLAARRQHPLEMHWKPVAQRLGVEHYGGGIQYGECFKFACKQLPLGAYPMCIGLHWDGTSARGIASSPICVCVGNSNSCKNDTQFCVGYIPHVPDEKKPEWAKQPIATEVKYYIRQQCATVLLNIMEESAKRGVVCRLLNGANVDVKRLLYPRLTSMNFDQPEAQLFFGMQNKTSCSKCRRRKGYSAFRRCQKQLRDDIKRLYHHANDPRSLHQLLSREKLHRWGFNYKRECCLLLPCFNNLLVRLPETDEVFPCVDYRDRMHGIIIFLHRVLYRVLDDVVNKAEYRRILDDRLSKVGARKFKVDGTTCRVQKSVFTETGMSASDKASLIFQLSHVIGIGPDNILPRGIHTPLATAISQAQLMLIVVSGRRSYTKAELDRVFNHGFVLFFGALESVRHRHYRRRLRAWSTSTSGPAPKRFKRETR